MKVALDWLSDHLDLSGYSQPELDDLLTPDDYQDHVAESEV